MHSRRPRSIDVAESEKHEGVVRRCPSRGGRRHRASITVKPKAVQPGLVDARCNHILGLPFCSSLVSLIPIPASLIHYHRCLGFSYLLELVPVLVKRMLPSGAQGRGQSPFRES